MPQNPGFLFPGRSGFWPGRLRHCSCKACRCITDCDGTERLADLGKACALYQNEHLRNLLCKRMQCDEIWSFCYAKEKNVPEELKSKLGFGAVPIFSIDCPSQLWDHRAVHFTLLGPITQVETFAVGSGIRELARLRKFYGKGHWRKRKGIAKARLPDGSAHLVEIHW